MASAVGGVAGTRVTLDLASKNSEYVECGEPDSARISGKSGSYAFGISTGSHSVPLGTAGARGTTVGEIPPGSLDKGVCTKSLAVCGGRGGLHTFMGF
jgi:hypothetical protein